MEGEGGAKKVFEALRGADAVSYTHLDVYKRQAQGIAAKTFHGIERGAIGRIGAPIRKIPYSRWQIGRAHV